MDWSDSAILGHRSPTSRDFADLVASRLIGSLLTWTARHDLLVAAGARGIGRFEANLIIAAVQHHRRNRKIPPAARTYKAASIGSLAAPWIAAVAVELAILASVWHLLA
ncbi:MAG: hypothetical protein M3O30_00295 [Planctomycetota bacterium]|nr:hypothetical protein [Planctomycetota bacterium]